MTLRRDRRNDLPVNAMGILTSAAGAKLAWWIDPAGAVRPSTCPRFVAPADST